MKSMNTTKFGDCY